MAPRGAVGALRRAGPGSEGFLKDFGGTRAVMVGAAIAAMKITNSVTPRPSAHPPTRRCTCLPPRLPILDVRAGQGPAHCTAPPIRCFDAAACAVARQPSPRSERLLFVPCAQIHPPVGAYAVLLADVPAIKARPPPPSVARARLVRGKGRGVST
jgi:hypothetical protein